MTPTGANRRLEPNARERLRTEDEKDQNNFDFLQKMITTSDNHNAFQSLLNQNKLYRSQVTMKRLEDHGYIIGLYSEAISDPTQWIDDPPAQKQTIPGVTPAITPPSRFVKSDWATLLLSLSHCVRDCGQSPSS